jgi:hypothetical protein
MLRAGNWHPDANTAYSLAFLVFWGLIAVASYVSHWLMSAQVSGSQEMLTHRLES